MNSCAQCLGRWREVARIELLQRRGQPRHAASGPCWHRVPEVPRWAQLLGEALPLTHFVRAVRGLLLRGDGLASVVYEMWPVVVFAALAAALAASQYRRHLG